MIDLKGQKILIIAPHPDDEVFGCGGLIIRAKKEGSEVYVLYLTVGTVQDFSSSPTSTEEMRVAELKKATEFLGIDGYRIALPGNDYHIKLDTVPQKTIINEIERGKDISIEALKPTMVFAPSPCDHHQDHRAAFDAIIAALRPADSSVKTYVPNLFIYELPYSDWSTSERNPRPNIFLPLTKEEVERKCEALRIYASQLKSKTAPLSEHGARTLAMFRGLSSAADAAEAYSARRVTFK